MDIKVSKITGNDKDRIGLFGRWTLTDSEKTIVISLTKEPKGFFIQQWAMDKDDNDIESLCMLLGPIAKKFYALKEVDKQIQNYSPQWKKDYK